MKEHILEIITTLKQKLLNILFKGTFKSVIRKSNQIKINKFSCQNGFRTDSIFKVELFERVSGKQRFLIIITNLVRPVPVSNPFF